ncbi:Nucleolar Complex 2 protein [Ascosphaera acerosa]|nr:Nucleolar Complex 2 protein [Ascosphaera acerosa]
MNTDTSTPDAGDDDAAAAKKKAKKAAKKRAARQRKRASQHAVALAGAGAAGQTPRGSEGSPSPAPSGHATESAYSTDTDAVTLHSRDEHDEHDEHDEQEQEQGDDAAAPLSTSVGDEQRSQSEQQQQQQQEQEKETEVEDHAQSDTADHAAADGEKMEVAADQHGGAAAAAANGAPAPDSPVVDSAVEKVTESKNASVAEEVKQEEKNKADQAQKTEQTDKEEEEEEEEEKEEELEEEEQDAEGHVQQLEALKEKDPEFYKYLKENDSELLDFGEHGDLAELDDLSETDTEIPGAPPKKKSKKAEAEEEEEEESDDEMPDSHQTVLTMEMVAKWNELMKTQHSLRATRQAVLAFRTAAYMSEAEEDERPSKYTISDSNVYHQVLVTALELVPAVLAHHLPTKTSAAGKVHLPVESKKFKTLTPLIKSHASSVVQLLTGLTDAAATKLTLTSIEPLLPYVLPFRKLARHILKTVVGVWADVAAAEATRITAFLVLRRTMVVGDAAICTAVVKATYEGIVKGSRNTTPYTLAGINLMKNSAAELWGVNQDVAYTAGFNAIRQLALHLRASITQPTKDSYKKVYNWQYVHSLDFWSRVLAMHCDALREATAGRPAALRPLIYPVVQLTLGAMRLIPTAQYLPLRFHLVRALLRLSRTTGTFIPLAAPLLEVFALAEMRKVPRQSTARPFDFATNIRAPKSYLRTRVYQDGVAEEALELLAEYHLLWTKSVAFPELALPAVVALKRWLKAASSRAAGNKNSKVNTAVLVLVQKLEMNAKWIEQRRQKVSFAPRDRSEVEAFLKDVEWESTPLGAYVKTLRRQKEEKEKIIAASREERDRSREERKKGSHADDDGDDDEDVMDESE